jgi:hypothetical protein
MPGKWHQASRLRTSWRSCCPRLPRFGLEESKPHSCFRRLKFRLVSGQAFDDKYVGGPKFRCRERAKVRSILPPFDLANQVTLSGHFCRWPPIWSTRHRARFLESSQPPIPHTNCSIATAISFLRPVSFALSPFLFAPSLLLCLSRLASISPSFFARVEVLNPVRNGQGVE